MTLFLLAYAFASPSLVGPEVELTRSDVRGTTQSIEAVGQDLKRLDPLRKADAVASLSVLLVNDPYTRAAMQLPFALFDVVGGIEADRFDRFVRRDWEMLQRGLEAHVAVLQQLEIDLAIPAPGDALYGTKGLVDLDTLLASKDPLIPTMQLIEQLPVLGEKVAPVKELLDLHSANVEAATAIVRPCSMRGPWAVLPGQPWTLGMELGGWYDALRRIQPFVEDPEVKERIDAMIELLNAYGEQTSV